MQNIVRFTHKKDIGEILAEFLIVCLHCGPCSTSIYIACGYQKPLIAA
jgi:hypothetical protein